MASRPRRVRVGRPHVLIRSSSERSRGRGMVHSWAACKWAPRTRCRPREGRFPTVTPRAAPGLLLRLCAARGAEHPPAPWENRERGGRGEEDGAGEEGRRGEMRGREASEERAARWGSRAEGTGRSWTLAQQQLEPSGAPGGRAAGEGSAARAMSRWLPLTATPTPARRPAGLLSGYRAGRAWLLAPCSS